MRILFLSGRETAYPRNDVLLRAFRRLAEVDLVSVDRRPRSLLVNSLAVSLRALPKLLRGGYDLVFVGFYGHLLMLPVSLLARRPILFDAFVSTYDTLGSDRQVIAEKSLAGRLARWLDRTACLQAAHVLLDTPRHIDYFTRIFGLPAGRFSALPVGCNEDLFFPQPGKGPGERTCALYYSSYLPLHGAETVLQAAALLKDAPVRFRLIGEGQEYPAARRIAEAQGLDNVEFVPPVPLSQLPLELANADICLGGHFGLSEKAGRVVPGKVYQVLATARPLIAGDTPANRDLLTEGETALMVPPGDAQDLADAVLRLANDPDLRACLAAGGRRLYEERCSEAVITRGLQQLVDKII